MPKKRTPRQRKAAAERTREQERVATQERKSEEQAKLVVERSGDPRFIQRRSTATGAVLSWDAGTPIDRRIRDAVDGQRLLFKEKFGREIGPEDHLFFDPDASEPVPLPKAKWDDQLTLLAESAATSGIDPAFILAWRDVGYIVMEDTRHTFSATEIEAYEEAVLRHKGSGPDAYGDPDVPDVDDIAEDQVADLPATAADGLEQIVSMTLRDKDTGPSFRLMDGLLGDRDSDDEAREFLFNLTFGVVTSWLVSAREQGIDPAGALNWVQEALGEEEAADSLQISGFIGHPLAPQLTVNEAHDRLGTNLLPAMIWLCAGVVATSGSGDAFWLRQFDIDS